MLTHAPRFLSLTKAKDIHAAERVIKIFFSDEKGSEVISWALIMPIIIFVVFAGIWLLNQAVIRSQLAMFSREVARECGIKYNSEWKGSFNEEAIKYCIKEKAEQEIFQENQITEIKSFDPELNKKLFQVYAPTSSLSPMAVGIIKNADWLNCKTSVTMRNPLKKLPRLVGENDADGSWWSKDIPITAEGSAKIESTAILNPQLLSTMNSNQSFL